MSTHAGFGNTISLASRPPSVSRFLAAYLHINFLVTIIALPMGKCIPLLLGFLECI